MTSSPCSQPEFDVTVESHKVPMRDGVRLATDVYLPARYGRSLPGPFPALLHRTQYDRGAVERGLGWCSWFAKRGYAAVIQDSRGTFGSEGLTNFLFPEAEDGHDTVNWIASQPWCTGKIGGWGISWAGWTQTAMATQGSNSIGALIPTFSGSNAYTSSVRHGGAFELRMMAAAFWVSAVNKPYQERQGKYVTAALNLGAPGISEWLQRLPLRRGHTQLGLVPQYEDWLFDLMTRADYEEMWRDPGLAPLEHLESFSDCPVLLVGGWYDPYSRGLFENYLALSRAKRGPIRALVGPWTHANDSPQRSWAGDAEFGEDAAVEWRKLHLSWFDRWFKGIDNGLDRESPLRIFVMGGGDGGRAQSGRIAHGGRWRDEREWPPARTRYTPYYMHPEGVLSERAPELESSSATYTFDPSDPVPTIGGQLSAFYDAGSLPAGISDPDVVPRQSRVKDLVPAGAFNQVEGPGIFGCRPPYLPLGSRRDILVFQTKPLPQNVEVTGHVKVALWVSTTAPDTDFTAKLMDVYPPSAAYPYGYAFLLADSIVRLRYRHNDGLADPLPPGEAARITVELPPTSNLFAAGHRIRIDVSSSNFPRFDVNPNTGEAPGLERMRAPADNTVYHDRLRPSHAVLPIMPACGDAALAGGGAYADEEA